MSACTSEKAPSWMAHRAVIKTSNLTSPFAQSYPGHGVGPRLHVGFSFFQGMFTQRVVPSFKGNFDVFAWPGWCSSPPRLPDPSVVLNTVFRFHAERAIDIITHILPEDHLLLASSKRVKGMDLIDCSFRKRLKYLRRLTHAESSSVRLKRPSVATSSGPCVVTDWVYF